MNNILEIISKIKNGDDNAFKDLLHEHERMIYKIINSQTLTRGDYLLDDDSLFQEGSLALYNAALTYDESKGMSFSSYAYMVIRSRIVTVIRNIRRKSNYEWYSIDTIKNVDYSTDFSNTTVCDNPPVAYHREIEIKENLEKFLAELPREDRLIFSLRSNDVSYKEIGKLLNMNIKKIDNRIRMLKRRLRKLYEEDKL